MDKSGRIDSYEFITALALLSQTNLKVNLAPAKPPASVHPTKNKQAKTTKTSKRKQQKQASDNNKSKQAKTTKANKRKQ